MQNHKKMIKHNWWRNGSNINLLYSCSIWHTGNRMYGNITHRSIHSPIIHTLSCCLRSLGLGFSQWEAGAVWTSHQSITLSLFPRINQSQVSSFLYFKYRTGCNGLGKPITYLLLLLIVSYLVTICYLVTNLYTSRTKQCGRSQNV